MADIFISYARVDKARVTPLVAALEAQGWSVWWDPEITPGQEFDSQISAALDAAMAVVVVWTPASVDSRWVRGEAREAADRGVLVPVRFDGARLPIDARAMHTTDLDDWKEDPAGRPFQDLSRALRALISGGASEGGARAAPRVAEPEDLGRSICVLPFVNMSGDPEQEYFSDGLSEELLNQLGQMKGLKVAARTSCFAFKGQTPDLKLVGDKLGVAHVLEGSVRKAGNRLRITAQLIKAADGYHLWSNTFNRELDDVFQIQEDIARAVADALKVTLGMGETLTPGGTNNVEAYDLYLRALAVGRQMRPADLIRGAELYRKALALDPDFASGWTGLAEALYFSGLVIPERRVEFHTSLDDAIKRALAIAPDFWGTHSARAMQAVRSYNWRAAGEALDKALALAPANEPSPAFYAATLHSHAGRTGKAVSYAEAARRIDPLSINFSYYLQTTLVIAGRLDEADEEFARSQDLTGDREGVEHTAVWCAAARGDAAALMAQMRCFLASESIPMPVLRDVSELLDQPDVARVKLRAAFEEPGNQDPTRQFKIAFWAAIFDDVDLSLSAARRAYVDGTSVTLNLIWLPHMRRVRADPRFKDLVRDVGLVDHWRETGDWGDFARPVGDDDFEMIA